jgi:hypothetical protein
MTNDIVSTQMVQAQDELVTQQIYRDVITNIKTNGFGYLFNEPVDNLGLPGLDPLRLAWIGLLSSYSLMTIVLNNQIALDKANEPVDTPEQGELFEENKAA